MAQAILRLHPMASSHCHYTPVSHVCVCVCDWAEPPLEHLDYIYMNESCVNIYEQACASSPT